MGELEISFLCGILQEILVSPESEVFKVIFPFLGLRWIPGKVFNISEIRFFHLGMLSWDIDLSYLTMVLCELSE